MKPLFILLVSCCFTFTSFAQLTQGNWLAGGTGNFLTSKYSYSSPTYTSSSDRVEIDISANIGYFIIDKLALGLKPGYSKFKDVVDGSAGNINSNQNRIYFGPFGRYYFLKADKQFNILTDVSYQYGLYWFTPTKGNSNTFSASAGTVVFFNTSVGLELLLGYYSRKEVIKEPDNISTNQKGFQMSVGFQIHLEK